MTGRDKQQGDPGGHSKRSPYPPCNGRGQTLRCPPVRRPNWSHIAEEQMPFFSRRNHVIWVYRNGVFVSRGIFRRDPIETKEAGLASACAEVPAAVLASPSGRGHGQLSLVGDFPARTRV